MNTKVTSLAKRSETLQDAAAAVFVISRDDIRRSGVTSIPEALRLAPGVEVTRKGANSWGVALRGFNHDLSNKLLVLIDGRSVYSPLYAGVFWDAQDTLLEDIVRIEVIFGPGGTLWGANAVNGVINIITRSSQDTQDGFAELGGGDEEKGFAGVRYGGRLGDYTARAYVKAFDRDDSLLLDGEDARDGWRMGQGGFRIDRKTPLDHYTLQGDIYSGSEEGEFRDDFTLGTLPDDPQPGKSTFVGGNLLARWERENVDRSGLRLQSYYDHTRRNIPGAYNVKVHTLDVDFQYHFRASSRQEVTLGAGVRVVQDQLDNTLFATFEPDQRTMKTYSVFAQDKVDLWRERLYLTLGSKFEYNDFTGFESQPNARLSWSVSDDQMLWASASRAVRVPSRLDADLTLTAPLAIEGIPLPIYVNVNGNEDFHSETLKAYETGWRYQPLDELSFDLAFFYNEYDDLQTMEPEAPLIIPDPTIPYIVLPNALANGMEGRSHGGTMSTQWQPVSFWRLRFQYAYLDLDLKSKPESSDVSAENIEDNSPRNQYSVLSFLDLPHNLSLYTGFRFVDELQSLGVDDYTALDMSLGWKASNDIEALLTVQNLTDKGHLEFGGNKEIERSVFARLIVRF
ncbi:TonB-dependent receptor [Hahella sp. CR1]|uniref:TonB-dependent receptor plug domain-containing protein n=1 Tax=Hahella sp. CR1 TaxID=2992807 RepID=UPI00244314FC|nr:TonB-dependent receptor [Hahella sp. CR1]MDG9668694.1 TonB-dependent receptor [Hahella sp. CR1]